MPYRHVLIVVLVPIIMGFGFVISKPAMEFFPPILLNGLRWSLSGLIMFWFFPFPKKYFKQIFFIALIGCTIQYSLTYPNHIISDFEKLDLTSIGNLNFEKPNLDKFPCIRLAYNALDTGGTATVVLNVANDIAVSAFLNKQISFCDIPIIIEDAITQHEWNKSPDLDVIADLGVWTQTHINNTIGKHA